MDKKEFAFGAVCVLLLAASFTFSIQQNFRNRDLNAQLTVANRDIQLNVQDSANWRVQALQLNDSVNSLRAQNDNLTSQLNWQGDNVADLLSAMAVICNSSTVVLDATWHNNSTKLWPTSSPQSVDPQLYITIYDNGTSAAVTLHFVAENFTSPAYLLPGAPAEYER